MKKALFIYNPNAGKGSIKAKVSDIVDELIKNGYMPTVYATQESMDAYRVVSTYKPKVDLVLCSGGDGTLDEVVKGMMDRKGKAPIGYIPAGSTNDFARSLGIPRDLTEATKVALTGKRFKCDIGMFNNEAFVYIAAFGLFTDVSYETSQEVKNMLGHMAYILEGAKRIYNVPAYDMSVYHDDEVKQGTFLFGMVTNSKSVGGFKGIIGDDIVMDDGLFEVTLIKKPSNILELQEIIGALLIRQMDSKHMISFQAKKVRFECEEIIAWTLDGEYGGEFHDVEIENRNKEFEIIIPTEEIAMRKRTTIIVKK